MSSQRGPRDPRLWALGVTWAMRFLPPAPPLGARRDQACVCLAPADIASPLRPIVSKLTAAAKGAILCVCFFLIVYPIASGRKCTHFIGTMSSINRFLAKR